MTCSWSLSGAMQIDFTGEVARAAREDPTTAAEDETMVEDSLVETTETDLFSETDEADPNQLPIHRFVIHLPQATKRQDARSSWDSDEDAEFDEAGMDDMGMDEMEPDGMGMDEMGTDTWDDASGENDWREE